MTSTEAREFSNATKVSSRSTTRSASAVARRAHKTQKEAPRIDRSEHIVWTVAWSGLHSYGWLGFEGSDFRVRVLGLGF